MSEDTVPLKQYVDQRIDDLYARIIASLEVIDKRFSSVNEFRQVLSDQQAQLVHKNEFEARMNALEQRVTENTTRLDTASGSRSGQATIGAVIVGVASALSAMVAVGAVAFDILRR